MVAPRICSRRDSTIFGIEHLTWPFFLIEVGNYLLTAYCLVHAWRTRRHLALIMVASMFYGWFVEYETVIKPDALYAYHQWIVALPGPVPLGIALSWGILIFAVWQTASYLKLPMWARPLFAGLLVIGVDFVMDPAFVYMEFWVWADPGPWFGIPWENFVGWFVIVSSFTLFLELGYHWFPPGKKLWRDLLVAFGAIGPSSAVLVGVMAVYVKIAEAHLPWLPESSLVLLIWGSAAAAVARPVLAARKDQPVDRMVMAIAIYLCAVSALGVYLSGCHVQYPPMILITPAFISLTLLGYGLPYLDRFKQP